MPDVTVDTTLVVYVERVVEYVVVYVATVVVVVAVDVSLVVLSTVDVYVVA